MLGCDKLAAKSASRRNRSRYWGSAVNSADNTFSASWRGNRGWAAKYTVPIAPAPSIRRIVNPANSSPTDTGMGES